MYCRHVVEIGRGHVEYIWFRFATQLCRWPEDDVSAPLIKAVWQGSLDVTTLLLESGADTEIGDAHHRTPLFYAKNIAVTKQLIRHGANVNHQNRSGGTPLFFTATAAEAKELLRHGADVNHQAKIYGETALFHAILEITTRCS